MPIHKNQRVGVFVDVQNLYYSAKQFYSAKVNFSHVLKKAVAGRNLIRAIAYVIKADIKEEHNFFEALEKIGYDVRAKDLQTFYTGAKKGDWDVGIAMDIMRMAGKLDVIVLISGDGDFKDLLEHVKALGCRAEVIGFGKTASSRLTREADHFYDLGKDLDKVLIKDGKYKKKHSNNKKYSKKSNIKKEGVENIPYQRPDGSFEKKVPKKSSSNKSQRKPAQRKPRRTNNNRNNKSHHSKKPYKKRRDNYRKDAGLSFLQKINMDQPDLTSENQKQEPKKQKREIVKKPAKKTTKKKPRKRKTKKNKTTRKPVKKKTTAKKKQRKTKKKTTRKKRAPRKPRKKTNKKKK